MNSILSYTNFYDLLRLFIKSLVLINLSYAKSHQNCHFLLQWSLKILNHKYTIYNLDSTTKPIAKILIDYNHNKLEENDEEEKKTIDVKFTEQNAYPKMLKNSVDFKKLDIQGEDMEDIAQANILRVYKSKLMNIFYKKIG